MDFFFTFKFRGNEICILNSFLNKHFLNNGENEKISNDVEEREGERERARERERGRKSERE